MSRERRHGGQRHLAGNHCRHLHRGASGRLPLLLAVSSWVLPVSSGGLLAPAWAAAHCSCVRLQAPPVLRSCLSWAGTARCGWRGRLHQIEQPPPVPHPLALVATALGPASAHTCSARLRRRPAAGARVPHRRALLSLSACLQVAGQQVHPQVLCAQALHAGRSATAQAAQWAGGMGAAGGRAGRLGQALPARTRVGSQPLPCAVYPWQAPPSPSIGPPALSLPRPRCRSYGWAKPR